jgi:hypothetical protein
MIRVEVRLDEHERDLARQKAKSQGISLAEFVRRAVRERLLHVSHAPWMRYAGMVESGEPHSSPGIDDVVYNSRY